LLGDSFAAENEFSGSTNTRSEKTTNGGRVGRVRGGVVMNSPQLIPKKKNREREGQNSENFQQRFATKGWSATVLIVYTIT